MHPWFYLKNWWGIKIIMDTFMSTFIQFVSVIFFEKNWIRNEIIMLMHPLLNTSVMFVSIMILLRKRRKREKLKTYVDTSNYILIHQSFFAMSMKKEYSTYFSPFWQLLQGFLPSKSMQHIYQLLYLLSFFILWVNTDFFP